jgi:hypothetical protein
MTVRLSFNGCLQELCNTLDAASESNIPMNVEYPHNTEEHRFHDSINRSGSGVSLAVSRMYRLTDETFNLSLGAYLRSVEMTRGTSVADNQVGRTRELVERAYRQDNPKIVMPPEAVPYLPMKIMPDRDSALGFLLVVG